MFFFSFCFLSSNNKPHQLFFDVFYNIHELDLELGDENHLPEYARVQIATKHTMHIFRFFRSLSPAHFTQKKTKMI